MKKRFMLSLMTVALVALLASGATFALFTDTTSNNSNTFSAGTVTLDDPVFTIADITGLAPGDTGSEEWTVSYSGSLDAYLGLDTKLSGDLATPNHTGSDGILANGDCLTVTITDNKTHNASNAYDNNADNQLVGKFSQNDTVTFTVEWELPLGANNGYQGDSATLEMLVHAVQADNNSESNITWE